MATHPVRDGRGIGSSYIQRCTGRGTGSNRNSSGKGYRIGPKLEVYNEAVPIRQNASLHLYTEVSTSLHDLISLSAVYCVFVTFVFLTDCESCTRPISTNPGSMEAGEYGLTRGICFSPHGSRGGRAAVDFVVFGAAGLRVFSLFFSSNAHGLLLI